MRLIITGLMIATLMACQQRRETPSAEAKPDRRPPGEIKGPIDPKRAEAAGQVVQSFGALIEQGRWTEAEALFADPATAAKAVAPLRSYWEVHLEIGELSEPEGAAGSTYISMPITFFGKTVDKVAFRDPATVVLRRVNGVPGSTEAQRRWHIARIEKR